MSAPERPPIDNHPPPRARDARLRIALLVLVIAIAVVGLAILTGRPDDPSRSPSPSQATSPSPTASTVPTAGTPGTTPTGSAPSLPPGSVTAFPDANGYGRMARGGRGGRVVYVTSLEDSGPGTLREALEMPGPRMVLFQVAGTIRLESNIDITDPAITIAGQSAPGDGVQLRGAMIRVMASDVIIRYMRLRSGDEETRERPADVDGITLHGVNGRVHDVIIDHSTLLWGPDIGGIAMLGDVRDVTVQGSIIGEGLLASRHPEGVAASGGHSMASNVTQLERGLPFGRRITFFRNLFTTSNERIPRFQGTQCADVINNVIYDWGIRAGHGNPRSLNMVANVFRSGPDTVSHRFWVAQHSDVAPRLFGGAVWLADNMADGFEVGGPAGDVSVFADAPACPLSIEPQPPRTIYDAILETVGASRPVRDAVDLRIISNVRERRGGFRNGEGQPAPNPDWPDLAPAQPEADADADGMPDSWELQAFGSLDRGDPVDSSGDADADGWTDLEEWLNDTDPNRADAAIAPG